MSRRSTSIVCLLTGLCLAAPSHAYRMIQNTTSGRVSAGNLVPCNDPGGFTHWNTRSIGWHHNTAGQGAGKATALQSAMASWTNVPSADHVLTYAGTTSAGWATDGVNTVLWAVGNGCTGSCLALTALVLQQPGQIIIETDVTFNASYTWQTNGSDYDTEAVAAHEFGHTLGIHHTEVGSSPTPTMNATYFGSAGRSLETDDRSALQCSESRYPISGGGSCTPVAAAYISHFTGLGCLGEEHYYTPYFGYDGIRRSWNGQGCTTPTLRTVSHRSYKDSAGNCYNAWPGGNLLSDFVAVVRPLPCTCGEESCAPVQGAYISHFTQLNCTGEEHYYTPYFAADGIRRSWDGNGCVGRIRRTVTNRSYKDSSGACYNAWPGGNTLSDFVKVYR